MLSETLIRRQAKRRRGQTRADAQEGFDLPDSLPLLRSNPPRPSARSLYSGEGFVPFESDQLRRPEPTRREVKASIEDRVIGLRKSAAICGTLAVIPT